MVKYLGSKRRLLPKILEAVARFDPRVVVDPFSGSGRVAHALKGAGYFVRAGDHNAYAATLARAYLADANLWLARSEALIQELNSVAPEVGPFTRTYCEEARYFQPKNGAKIEAIRNRIAALNLEPELEAIALVSLMEAADRVDSTTGLQMAYLKSWAERSFNELAMRPLKLLPGPGEARQAEALETVALEADVAYLDPPYNQHSYLGNYHVWESLVLWDHAETYGVARKRVDVRKRPSVFNSRARFETAFRELVEAVRAPNLVVSFSDEGFLSREALTAILEARGRVEVLEIDHPRYVGAQIGVYNPAGEKVGEPGRLRNREFLFTVG